MIYEKDMNKESIWIIFVALVIFGVIIFAKVMPDCEEVYGEEQCKSATYDPRSEMYEGINPREMADR